VKTVRKENENIYLFIIKEEYARNKAKQKANAPFLRTADHPRITTRNSSAIPSEPYKEEIGQLNEKKQLVKAKQESKLRKTEQIKRRKRRINQMKAEILELRQECQTLATALRIRFPNNNAR
jgi:hypothetical protein